MKVKLEEIHPDTGSSFRILRNPGLNHLYYWHFHPEYEIVYVEGASGIRHIGDHISRYEENDLVFIGPNIPHLNFDFGVKTECNIIVIQMKEDFLGKEFLSLPELKSIRQLFGRSKNGLLFTGETKRRVGEKLKILDGMDQFDQLMTLLDIFRIMSNTEEVKDLGVEPVTDRSSLKEKQRMNLIYRFVEDNYQQRIDSAQAASLVNLSNAAFCRYFKKISNQTFTDFLNRYRINQAKKMLLMDKNVTETCYDSGFENLSHFNKTFRKMTGENPSQFRKRHATNG